MKIRTARAIRETLGGLLVPLGFCLEGRWPLWTWERQIEGQAEKVELLVETSRAGGGALAEREAEETQALENVRIRRMNVNFAVRRTEAGIDRWMNRPMEEWFEYEDENSLERQLQACVWRIESEVLPWMKTMRTRAH
ncbi:hypothetical protein [Saccharibacillus alkalitolerans]|uniref:Uncharacterized protein n=1 Tax=Saccharibacillus alkalitolerans TaxID=2705290 RepID=A0ABX0F4I0_9BACL|nr:hypothetical protein [Saccharibacillus alkalitolerans]NGZ75878.1 hypothetical protein [Saccharibacillus alkalitolerans]